MRVLVTGGAGFIGSHVVEHLVALGADVGVLDNLSSGDESNLHGAMRVGLIEADMHVCDVRDQQASSIIRSYRPDAVVHLAAQSSVARSVVNPADDASVNVAGTVNVIHAAASAGATNIVFAATAAIYGNLRESELPVPETHSWSPVTPYGLSKATGLRYLDLLTRTYEIGYAGLVLGNVYGPRQRVPSVIPTFLECLRTRRNAQLHGGGRHSRDFVYVTDVARAVVAACGRTETLVANIGSGTETRIRDLHRLITATVGGDPDPVEATEQPGELPRMRLDIRRAASVLDWAPHVGLAEGITRTFESARTDPLLVGG